VIGVRHAAPVSGIALTIANGRDLLGLVSQVAVCYPAPRLPYAIGHHDRHISHIMLGGTTIAFAIGHQEHDSCLLLSGTTMIAECFIHPGARTSFSLFLPAFTSIMSRTIRSILAPLLELLGMAGIDIVKYSWTFQWRGRSFFLGRW
jgi:hypothetical protein